MSADPLTPPSRTALVIDDDDDILALLRFIFERDGYVVEVARDGRSADDCLRRLAAPAIVTLDVMLPHFDGFELLARLRGRPGWSEVPVIMLSAKAHEKDVARALDAGANDYLVKPFRPEELRARIRRLLRQ